MERDRYPEGWQDGVEIVFSVWLILSPFILGFSSTSSAALTAIMIGTAVFALSQFGAANQKPWEEWLNLAVALFLGLSPFFLGYSSDLMATWNAIITGLFVGGFAIASMSHEYLVLHRMHHPNMG